MGTIPAMFQLADAEALSAELTELRRDLHRHPEIGLDLPVTQRRILRALDGLDLEISTGQGLSSVTAVLRGGAATSGERPAVLLRGDMDALPVQEESGLPFASETPGAMHACGHDLHVAGLLGAARLLTARRAELPGDVVFMFQPGEETVGGARIMLEEGVLEAAGRPVDAAYGLHVSSNILPFGFAATRPGPLMASADEIRVTVHGRGGHGSAPHTAVDPVPALCALVGELQTMVTRTVDAFDPAVLTIGTLAAGTAENVIPDTASCGGTVRTFSERTRELMRANIRRVVDGVAAAHGVRAELEYREGYPVTANDPAEAAFALDTARELLGADAVLEAPTPISGAEDFSYVLQRVPGAYLFVGACPPGTDPSTAPANHSPRAVHDDAVLPRTAALLAELAARSLSRPAAAER